MKLVAEDEYKIVTIESKATGLNISELVLMFRGLAMALEYHPDSVRAQIPDENELDDIISDAINAQRDEDILDKADELTENDSGWFDPGNLTTEESHHID